MNTFFAMKYMLPMMELLAAGGCISNSYWNLPMEGDDPDGIAWAYYYGSLQRIRTDIRSRKDMPDELKKELLALWKDVRGLICNESGFDDLSDRWFEANPKLIVYTTRNMLYSDLREEGAIDTMAQLGFTLADVLFYRRTSHIDIDEDCRRENELLKSFVAMAFEAAKDYVDVQAVTTIINKEMAGLDLSVSAEEKERLKEVNDAYKHDRAAMEKEGKKRLKSLKAMGVDVSSQKLSKELEERKKWLEKSENVCVYHIIKTEDAVQYLCVTHERLYWANQRPYDGPIGLYTYGYEVSVKDSDSGRFGPMKIRKIKGGGHICRN